MRSKKKNKGTEAESDIVSAGGAQRRRKPEGRSTPPSSPPPSPPRLTVRHLMIKRWVTSYLSLVKMKLWDQEEANRGYRPVFLSVSLSVSNTIFKTDCMMDKRTRKTSLCCFFCLFVSEVILSHVIFLLSRVSFCPVFLISCLSSLVSSFVSHRLSLISCLICPFLSLFSFSSFYFFCSHLTFINFVFSHPVSSVVSLISSL